MDVHFNHLESLHWLWLVAAVIGVMWYGAWRRRHALMRFASTRLLERLAGRPVMERGIMRIVLLLGALLMMVAALLDPRWGVEFQQVQQRGVDVMIVLDVSRSMSARDARPSRLERAKQFVRDLVEQCAGDRVGLVTFAGVPAVKCPVTIDYGAFVLSLDLVGVESGGRGGSLLGDALRRAVTAFPDDHPDHKAIVVFSDGEDHGSFPLEAASDIASELSIPVFTVGIGDDREGSRIPIEDTTPPRYLVHDGEEVWSIMNASLLREIALQTGGAYVPVGTGTVDMGEVYRERIAPIATREFETVQRTRRTVRFQWFAGLALVLLLIESFMSERRDRSERVEA